MSGGTVRRSRTAWTSPKGPSAGVADCGAGRTQLTPRRTPPGRRGSVESWQGSLLVATWRAPSDQISGDYGRLGRQRDSAWAQARRPRSVQYIAFPSAGPLAQPDLSFATGDPRGRPSPIWTSVDRGGGSGALAGGCRWPLPRDQRPSKPVRTWSQASVRIGSTVRPTQEMSPGYVSTLGRVWAKRT